MRTWLSSCFAMTLGWIAVISFAIDVSARAEYDGAEPRRYCAACESEKNSGPSTPSAADKSYSPSKVSLTRGNLFTSIPIAVAGGGKGSGLYFSLSYNSYTADGSKSQVNTGVGYGWTHSYNRFLFTQRGHIFRADGEGGITKFPRIPGTSFPATPSWFETLVDNGNGTYTILSKDKTRENYGPIPGTPFLYNGPVLRLQSIVDRNGSATTLIYSPAGDLVQIRDTYNRTIQMTYVNHRLATITDPLSRVTKLEYDTTGSKLTKVTDPASKTTLFTYNTLYQITQVTDRDGRVFTNIYNALRQPVGVKDSLGKVIYMMTNTSNWATDKTILARDMMRVYVPSTTSVTDGRGNVWKYDYDQNGYVTRVVAPDGATTRYEYDPATLQIATVTDAKQAPNTGITRFQYDATGNVIKVTDALSHITKFTYDPVYNQKTSMVDPNSRTTQYTVDPANGNTLSEKDPLLQTRSWTYDARGNVLTSTDKRGNVTTSEYDAFGNCVKITDPLPPAGSSVTTMTYDTVGNMLTRTDPIGHTTRYTYDSLDRCTTVTDPRGGVTGMTYNNEGDVTKVTDQNLHSTTTTYDQRRRAVTTTDARNKISKLAYDDNDNCVSVTDRNAHTTLYTYDLQNRRTKTTDALVEVTSIAYDEVGNRVGIADPNGHTTLYTYDPLNRLTSRTDPVNASNGNPAVTRYDYDMINMPGAPEATGPTLGSNQVTKQTDAEGKVTYFAYDALDRNSRVVRKIGPTNFGIAPDDALTTSTYDADGNRLTVTVRKDTVSDLTSIYQYDELNRRTQDTNPAGDVVRYQYDPVGNLVKVFAPNGNVTTNVYDEKDELKTVDDSSGPVGRYTYDAAGNRLTNADGNGNTTTSAYDELNRVITLIDAMGKPTVYVYDAEGNLKKVTDRNSHVTTYDYDDVNRKIRMTDGIGNQTGMGHITLYDYDRVGNQLRVTDANGNPTVYTYDGLNRPTSETYSDTGVRSYTYNGVGSILTRTDQNGRLMACQYDDLHRLTRRASNADLDTFTYDLASRPLTATRNGWLVTFTYDGANRIVKSVQNGQTIIYAYDIPGRTRTVTYPGGRVVTEHTDPRTRLDSIGDGASPTPIVQYAYDPGNRVTGRAYRNGAVAGYSYNANNWMLQLNDTVGPQRIIGFTYGYDNEGNKLFEGKMHNPPHSEAYAYDAIDRLVNYLVGPPGGAATSQTLYDLDPVGNWNHKVKNGVTESRAHNGVNEITAFQINMGPVIPLSYDQDGNLLKDNRLDYRYDEENRLIHTADNTGAILVDIADYRYDALGRRVSKRTLSGVPVETRYFYDGQRIIEEQNTAGATQATYVYGNYIDEVLTMDRGGQSYYYHQNALSSVHALTNAIGARVEGYEYDAYGRQTVFAPGPNGVVDFGGDDVVGIGSTSLVGNPWMFTGRQLDDETNLYYFRARSYDSNKGRFLQRDPLVYVDGYNLYASHFVPNGTDPFGLQNWKWFEGEGRDIKAGQTDVEIEDFTQRFIGLIMPRRAMLSFSSGSTHLFDDRYAEVLISASATFDHFNSWGRLVATGWSYRSAHVIDNRRWECDPNTGTIREAAFKGGLNPTDNNVTSDGPLQVSAKIISAEASNDGKIHVLTVKVESYVNVGGQITETQNPITTGGSDKTPVQIGSTWSISSTAGKSFGPFQATYVFKCKCDGKKKGAK